MIDHMRSEEAPAFINLDSDSTAAAAGKGEGATPKPAAAKTARDESGKARKSPGKP